LRPLAVRTKVSRSTSDADADQRPYTAGHLANVAKALADIREGRVRRLSDDDLAAYDD
jgi:hypothetical protein